MKVCISCGERKPLEDYYGHSQMADGHLGKCKECCKRDARTNRQKNLEYYRAYDRSRADNLERVIARAMYAQSNRAKIKIARSGKQWRKLHRYAQQAHNAVARAVRSGKLKAQPCELCRAGKTHAHHDDYSKPLAVRWLCPECHAAVHKQERQQLRSYQRFRRG